MSPDRYGKILTKIWNDPDFRKLSKETKLVLIYFLTSPHSNCIGLYILRPEYAAADLQVSVEDYRAYLKEIVELKMVSFDEATCVLFVHNYLKYNPVKNPKHITSAIQAFRSIPYSALTSSFMMRLETNAVEWECEPLLNAIRLTFDSHRNDKRLASERQPNTGTGTGTGTGTKKQDMSGKPDVQSLKEQSIQILNLLNEKAGRAYQPTAVNLGFIVARLKDGATLQDCKQVIIRKCREWKGDPKMDVFLRPATLFNREKFDQYQGQLVAEATPAPGARK